jgi:hypothetical protein
VSFAEREVPGSREIQILKEVVFFFFAAHGKECGGDDHNEKDQCKDQIVNHWGESPLAALAVSE